MARGVEAIAALRGSGRDGARRVDAAEWTARSAGPCAARRHRDHLREPAQRHRGCRCAVPEVGQRGDPARRQRERAFQRRDPRGAWSQARFRRPAGRGDPARTDTRTGPPWATCWPRWAGAIDVIVPRGGKSLIERVQPEARVPVIGHLDGICHVYVDRAAGLEMARAIVLNAKMRRTGICGAAETLLVDRGCADTHLAPLVRDLLEAGCEVRGDASDLCGGSAGTSGDRGGLGYRVPRRDHRGDASWTASTRRIAHIARYGSAHTDSIVTGTTRPRRRFLAEVDSAIVMHNASTQFADGGEFGMGAEIGISTDRFHARGPVGARAADQLQVPGAGQRSAAAGLSPGLLLRPEARLAATTRWAGLRRAAAGPPRGCGRRGNRPAGSVQRDRAARRPRAGVPSGSHRAWRDRAVRPGTRPARGCR